MKTKRHHVYMLITLTLASIMISKALSSSPAMAYVVCADSKIYVVDLKNGRVVTTSKPINGLGGPSSIDINIHRSQLYIASDRSLKGKAYDPIISVDVKGNKFKVTNRFQIEPVFDLINDPKKIAPMQNAVYSIMTSPDEKLLYTLSSAASGSYLTTVIDSQSGEIVRKLKIGITQNLIISPDGKKAAEIWPDGITYHDEKQQNWSGGVAVNSLIDGKLLSKVSLKNNQDLSPPWQSPDNHFIYFNNQSRAIDVYDRITGKLLSSVNIGELTQLLPLQKNVVRYGNKGTVAISMSDGNRQGYVVVIDLLKQKVIHKIAVGPAPTNVVLAG